MKLAWAAAIALGCASGRGKGDTFVAGGTEISGYAVTADGRVKVPLAAGLAWATPTVGKDTILLRIRSDNGPTFVIVAVVDGAPKPLALNSCAKAHGDAMAKAISAAGVFTSPPMISEDTRRGEKVPRLHYVVPLHAAEGVRGAATLSWWTYYLDGSRCVAVGVTSVVHEKVDDPNTPDPEDMHRMERVFSLVAEATTVTP